MTLKVVMSEFRSMLESYMRVLFVISALFSYGGWIGNEVGGSWALVYLF